MSTPNDGGPAFPYAFHFPDQDGQPGGINFGMTLRDYFAAKAMAAMLTSVDMIAFASKAVRDTGANIKEENSLAVLAYNFADTMLAVRKRKGAS